MRNRAVNLTPNPSRRRGFTLLELLTVVAIIAVLCALLVGAVAGVRERARRAQALSFIRSIEDAAKVFQLAYNRWPWEIEGKTLAQKLPANDIFAELAPANTALAAPSYQTLANRQRVTYLAIPPNWIRDGKVVDVWGNELEFFWNPDTCSIVIVAPANNRRNDTIDTTGLGRIRPPSEQADDVNNL